MASLPSFFIPKAPPSPPSASSAQTKTPLSASYRALKSNVSFYLVFVPFSVYVGFFNASSSLLNQILEPYGFSETEAGIAGALLIVVGLVTSAVVSPLIDRTKQYVVSIKILVPLIAAMVSNFNLLTDRLIVSIPLRNQPVMCQHSSKKLISNSILH